MPPYIETTVSSGQMSPVRSAMRTDPSRTGLTLDRAITPIPWREENFSLWTKVQATWSILIAQYSGSSDVAFKAALTPATTSSRDGVRGEDSGSWAAMVPVQVFLKPDMIIADLLRQMQTLGKNQAPSLQQPNLHSKHLDTPVIGPASPHDIFTVALQADQDEKRTIATSIRKRRTQASDAAAPTEDYALKLACRLHDCALRLTLSFDPKFLDRQYAERVLQQLEHILLQLCLPESESKTLAALATTSERDLSDIWSWNAAVPAAKQECVHHLIADVIHERPQEPAVCAWDGNLTYAELDRLSTSLAYELVARGVGPEVLVPLLFEKSKWTPVAMLGVMKAGGASIAMDATLPDQRLRTIMVQANGPVVISSTMNTERATRIGNGAAVITPQLLSQGQATQEIRDLPTTTPSNALYVVFTSGSTGTPKGVIITHSNYTSAIHLQQDVGFTTSSRVYDFASYAFDIAWSNVLRTFMAGGCLCIPSQEDRQNAIAESICRLGANHVDLTPSVARLVEPSQVPGLRHITFAGEALLAQDITPWRNLSRLLNVYGPAECTVGALVCEVGSHRSGNPSIGRGSGVNTWIVDGTGSSLVSVGCIGELWIEGPLVGRGYLSDPDKTAAVFVEDPIWLLNGGPNSPGRHGRVYRTGDLVRYNLDGSLAYIGRKDAQVKIQGQRVELGDVEDHVRRSLREHVDCQVVAEVIIPIGSTNPILVAFISINTDTEHPRERDAHDGKKRKTVANISVEELTAGIDKILARQLPTYMVPTAYIPLPQIPMTATGKTDRRQLREMGAAMALKQLLALYTPRTGSRKPATEMELQLRDLWAKVLGINGSKIGNDDSFLRIGGDSMAAMRLVGAARECGLELTVATIFEHPQLRFLARLVKVRNGTQEEVISPFSLLNNNIEAENVRLRVATLLGMETAQIEDIYPCTPLQEGLLALTAKRPGNYVSRIVLELHEHVSMDRFRAAWEHVIASTPILRTRICALPEQGMVQTVIAQPLRWSSDQRVETIDEGKQDLAMGLGTPLSYFNLAEKQQSGKRFFTWTVHHALYDGWSMSLVLDQAEHAYNLEQTMALAQFQPFVRHILDLDPVLATSYWQSQFSGCEATIFPALPNQSYQPCADRKRVREVSKLEWPTTGITASTVMRVALSILISRYTATMDVVFGATVTGRQAAVADVERMAGPTITTVPIRIRADDDADIMSICQSVQMQATQMTEFEQTGLQRIRRIDPSLEQATQFQTLLVIQPSQSGTKESVLFKTDGEGDNIDEIDGTDDFNTYALELVCQLRPNGVQIRFCFDSNVVEDDQVSRMAQQLEHILRKICAPENSRKKISAVEWTSEQDLSEIWINNISPPVPIDRCVNEIIVSMAQNQPQAPAVCAWDGDLTYGELDKQSTRLAHYLVTLGISTDKVVPLLFEKSKWVPIAVLGVMKAGGASLLLDISQPDERLRSILAKSRASTILSSRTNRTRANLLGASVVDVVLPELLVPYLTDTNVVKLPSVHPSDRLYVTFTSGSTGTPKGAVVTHSNFSSAIHYQSSDYKMTTSSRVYDFASYSFDVAWLNLLYTLAMGACICIPKQDDRQNRLAESIRSLKANWVHLTPSVARLLDPLDVPELQHLCYGGEALLAEDAVRWQTLPRQTNSYGPAECTVNVSMHHIQGSPNQNPSIGSGSGACLWVVDSRGNLASFGGIGELWIEGPLVGQGYLSEPEKTAAAFVQDPIWLLRGGPGHRGRRGRLYKTGDLVRHNPDGSLQYLGRKDGQIKIHGQRIELDDIAHHVRCSLLEKASCQVVVELISPEGSSTPALTAFICLKKITGHNKDGTCDTISNGCISNKEFHRIADDIIHGIEDKLAERLPTYMMPAFYIPVKEIPMTPTGKTDRRHLREIGASLSLHELSTKSTIKHQEPSTTIELQLRDLWAKILEIESSTISVNDSFLKLGGDSIAAMRLVSIAREHGLSFTVADIFKHSHLCRLAQVTTRLVDVVDTMIKPFSLIEIDKTELRAQVADLCGLNPAQIEDTFPCTPLQEGLLALSAKRPGDYVSRTLFQLREDVDLSYFKVALSSVVATVPILRTRVVNLNQQGLVQVVVAATPIQWLDAETVDALVASDKETPFALGTPLIRFGLHGDKAEGKYYFMWTMHHAIYDGWLWQLLLEQVETAYKIKQPPKLALAPFQPFVQQILSLKREDAKKYWETQLEDSEAIPFPALPSKNYLPISDQSYEHSVIELQWPKVECTTSTIVRVAWSILIASFTNVQDVIFGVTVTGRQAPIPNIQRMAGPTIATVPLRIRFGSEISVLELFQQVQAQATEMIQFEQTGLHCIRRLAEDIEQTSQFQTLVVIQPENQIKVEASPVFQNRKGTGDDAEAVSNFNAYALMLGCELQSQGLRLIFDFDSSILNYGRVVQIAEQFEHIIRQLCAPQNKQKRVADVHWMSPQDLRSIWNWNAKVPAQVERCVHDFIFEKVRQSPQAPAICAWDGDLTYAELDDLSTCLAYHLIALGVKKGSIVPLLFEKSKWMPVAMLGVMKAGGASVALDTNLPDERLRLISTQTPGPVIISSAISEGRASSVCRERSLVVPERLTSQSSTVVARAEGLPIVHPEDTLYIVFTSGSTGVPKGVVITHSNFSSAIAHQQKALGFGSETRLYDFVSYAFDIAWSNNVRTLAVGGCICIPSEADRKNAIANSILHLRANTVVLTPSVARTLDPIDVPSLEVLIFGGESALATDVLRWKAIPKLINGYGPAECTVMSTANKIEADSEHKTDPSLGYGRGMNTWIVQSETGASLVPIGGIGELWLEGPLVSQGYLGDPQKTAAAFVEDPAWLKCGGPGHPGRSGRLYKTGDLVQYDLNGEIKFIGRKDTQVKIRGQRIELGDIEHHIRQHLATLDNCHVVVDVIRPRQSKISVLGAFISVDAGVEGDCRPVIAAHLSNIEEQLSERLPAYMVPTIYIPIRSIPMTVTGKTDRRQLLELGASMTLKELSEPVAAGFMRQQLSTEMELQLRDLWAAVLDIDKEKISVDDNFLRIGGDSITAMRLVSMARGYNLDMSVAAIFENPRLKNLATVTRRLASADFRTIEPFSILKGSFNANTVKQEAAALCSISPDQVEDVFPCTALQEGLLALTAKRPGDYVNRSIFKLRGGIDSCRFKASWETIVARVPILRTRIVDLPRHGMVQVVTTVPINWSDEAAEDIPLRLEENDMILGGPLLRYSVNGERSGGGSSFTLVIHHALYDGWSLPLILDQVEKEYLQEPVIQLVPFHQFVKHTISHENEQMEQYWLSQFSGCEAAPFPTLVQKDYQPHSNGIVYHRIAGLTWPASGITPATIIRAALSILMASYTSSYDTVFGTTVTGRQASITGVELIAGPTIATVPVRVQINAERSVHELLQQVQIQAIDMIRFEQTGLQRIRRIGRDLELVSQFQTLLVIQPQDREESMQSMIFESGTEDKVNSAEAASFGTYALTLVCEVKNDNLQLTMHFDDSLTEIKQVQRMADQLDHILKRLCEPGNQNKTVSTVQWTSQFDLNDIWNWNKTAPSSEEQCVHHLIADIVRIQPQAPAICAWDGDLTYSELDMQSTRLAQRLVSIGVGPEVLVPLFFEKSKWMPIAMLGVLKAGGASVALDTALPHDRLQAIIDQVTGPVVISSTANETRSHGFTSTATVLVPERVLQETIKDVGTVQSDISPSNKLYVVFTSGSTGTPKGVAITHSNFSSAVQQQTELFGFSRETRIYDFASYAFDLAWFNNLHSLARGACVCIPSQADRQNAIAQSMSRLRANCAVLTPSTARAINPADVPGLETLIFGGEPVLAEDVAQWKAVPRLLNAYGPAECTVLTTAYVIDKSQTGPPSIGWSVGGNAWVVDASQGSSLVPIGSIGELLLEGPLVGQGYLADALKIAASFIEDPPWLLHGGGPDHPGRRGRLYKTGDLVRYNANGSLTYVGRKDEQVKIRGQRLELGDIEHHIQRSLTSGSECQLVVEAIKPKQSSDSILAIFVGMTADIGISDEQYKAAISARLVGLHDRLNDRLPAYMVPSVYIPLRQIPMTTTGKTDRRKLHEIGASMTIREMHAMGASAMTTFRAPTAALELQLRELWADVLGIESSDIGADDSFLQVGGDSITAMRLVGAAKQQNIALTVSDVFQHPRLSDLASVIGHATIAYENPKPFSLVATGADVDKYLDKHVRPYLADRNANVIDVYPITGFQRSRLSKGITVADRDSYHFYLDLPSGVDLARLTESCRLLCNRVDILRTIFIRNQQEYLQVVMEHLEPRIDTYALESDMAAECKDLYDNDLRSAAPLGSSFLRFFITYLPDRRTRLTMRISHAQYDGLSFGPLISSLTDCYNAREASPIPAFAGYVKYALSRQGPGREYWRSLLSGSSLTVLPVIRTTVTNSNESRLTDGLIEFTKRIPKPPAPEGLTSAALFTALCACAIGEVAASTDVVIGSVVSGRSMLPSSLQGTIGPCVNIIPIRAQLAEQNKVEGAAASIREQLIAGINFETSFFDDIVQHCTEWHNATEDFGFMTQFRNIEQEFTVPSSELFGRLDGYRQPEARQEALHKPIVELIASPVDGMWELEVTASARFYAQETIVQLVEKLVDLIAACG